MKRTTLQSLIKRLEISRPVLSPPCASADSSSTKPEAMSKSQNPESPCHAKVGHEQVALSSGGVVDQGPLELAGRVHGSEPPVVVTRIVEEHLATARAVEVADPEGAAVIDGVAEPGGVTDQGPLELGGGVHGS